MARRFALTERLTQVGTPFLDIPHFACLRGEDLDSLLTRFTDQWGVTPKAVVLPVTAPDGLLFPVDGLGDTPVSSYAAPSTSLSDFSAVVVGFARRGLDIWLSIDPTLPFLRADPL